MIEFDDQLKLQTYLDGELPEVESRAVAERLATDPEWAALLNELRQTCQALQGFQETVPLPESRDFYWSKIAKEIQSEARLAVRPAVAGNYFAWMRRWATPLAGLAAALAIVAVVSNQARVASVETALSDSGAFTYHNFTAGTTLVWLSYPAENQVAESDDFDTLPY